MGFHPVAVRAATAALVLITASCNSSDTTTAVEAEQSSSTVETDQSATTVPGTTPATPESTRAIETATAFIEARDRLDLDATLALLSPDAAILDFGFWPRTPDEYAGLFEWMEILEWRWSLERCWEVVPEPPVRVTCVHNTENVWSRAQGSDPVRGELEFVIRDDGLIVEVTSDLGVWIDQVFRPWFSWLVESHEPQIPAMYRLNEQQNLTGGPATTPEALDLYRTYVPEYVEWISAE